MGNVVVRAYEAGDREAFGHIRSVTYRGGESVPPDDRLLRDDCTAYVAEIDGELVASATVLDMTATKNGSTLRCAGLAAVAVVPEKRRSGIGGRLMTDMLPLLKEAGFAMASLYPFRASYYRNFGYEYAGARNWITCPTSRLPKVPSNLNVRLLNPDQWEEIAPVYTKFAKSYAGMNIRKTDQWWRVLGGDTPFQIYAAGDPIEGYAVLRPATGFWGKQTVKELIWNSREGYETLLGLIGSLSINQNEAEWFEPSDSPYLSVYMDQGAKVSFDRALMYRIIDLKACLGVLSNTGEGEFSLEVVDEAISDNHGAWRVCFGQGKVSLTRTGEGSIQTSIGHLTQALLGDPGFNALHRQGALTVGDQKEGAAAAELFGDDFVYCADFF